MRPARGDSMTLGVRQYGWVIALAAALLGGCTSSPVMLKPADQVTIDRSVIEYPPNSELKPLVRGLTAPVGVAWDADGSMLVAESGEGSYSARIFGFKPDGTYFDVYPQKKTLPFNIGGDKFKIYAPIGGLAVHDGRVYVSHRDANGNGVI